MRRAQLPVLLVALALASSATACTSPQPGSQPTSTPPSSAAPQGGGTVVVAVPRLPTNFNPWTPEGANPVTAEVMEQVWPQAFVTDSQGALTTEPGFLEDAEVESLSPFTVVYTLNPSAVWSDGKPIGVADFVYNWQQQLRWAPDLPESGLAAGYEAISSITSSNGGSTVTVAFSHPYTEWESLFSDLVPAHVAEHYGWAAPFDGFHPGRLVSGGPFEITSYTPGVKLVLSRNPHYWFTPASVAHIVLEVEPSADVLSDVETGRVDIAETPAGPAVGEAVAQAAQAGILLTASTVELPTLWQLCFNTTAPTVDTTAFRAGIEHSLYLDEITADSAGLEDSSILPYGNQLVLGQATSSGPATNVFGSGTTPSGGSASAGAGVGYDVAAAEASFSSAGYVRAQSGALRLAATGQAVKLSLLVPAGVAAVQQAADVIQAELGAVGIDVVLHVVSLDSMLGSLLPLGEYQMALAPFLLTTFPASELPVYSGSVLPSGAPPPAIDNGAERATTAGEEPGATEAGVVTRDVFGLNDPTVTSDLTQALTNLNPTDDESLIVAAETRLWLDLPTIPLFQQPVDVVSASDISSVSDSPTWAGVFWDAQDWLIQSSPAVVPSSASSAS